MKSWAAIFLLFTLSIGCTKKSSTLDQALAMTVGTGLMLSEQDKDDLEAFLKTLTDFELISDERYSSPF